MYTPSEEEPQRKYLLIAVAAILIIAVATAFVILGQAKEDVAASKPSPTASALNASNKTVTPTAKATPKPQKQTAFSNIVGTDLQMMDSMQPTEEGVEEEFSVENTGDEEQQVDVVEAYPPEYSDTDSVFTESGFNETRALSTNPLVRASKAVLPPGKKAVKKTTTKKPNAKKPVRVVTPPLSDDETKALAQELTNFSNTNYSFEEAANFTQNASNEFHSNNSFAQKLQSARDFLRGLFGLPPLPQFNSTSFLDSLPKEIDLEVSEFLSEASSYISLPLNVKVLARVDGAVAKYSSLQQNIESLSVYFDFSTAPKKDGKFDFNSMEGALVLALPEQGNAQKSIPIKVTVSHLTQADYAPTDGAVVAEAETVTQTQPETPPTAPAGQTQLNPNDVYWPTSGEFSGMFHNPPAHQGLDITNYAKRTPVVAAAAGRVDTVITTEDSAECRKWFTDCGKHGEKCPGKAKPASCSTCGKEVAITDSLNRRHIYCHLDEVVVKQGDTVQACQLVAYMGMTGNAVSLHLHYEVRTNNQPADPLKLFTDKSSSFAYQKTTWAVAPEKQCKKIL